ncbi:MAG: cobalamin B12-binding domain-containing protein [Candidatus Nealsonbacteria bacterium]|nr:cobalamin B12-binding domain-containing protein [Candidatus Nealsonbacteria bacterium]
MAHHENGTKIREEILLINPPPFIRRDPHDHTDYPHIGLAYISAYLRQSGFECRAIDAKFEDINMEGLKQRLKQYNPGIIGITAFTHEVKQAARVARLAKEFFPGVLIVLGGPHATALPEATLEQFPEFDMLVAGEGEITFLETVNAIFQKGDFSKVAGLVFRSPSGRIVFNGQRYFLADLDSLPFPAWDMFPLSEEYPLLTVRGCPFDCNFCMRISGRMIRKRSPKMILQEIKLGVERYGANIFNIHDESFGIDKEQTDALLSGLIESNLNRKVKLIVTTRVDLVDEPLLQKLKAAGCSRIGFGVESGNEEILKKTGKGITLKKAEESVFLAKKAGLKTSSFFIIGHPNETRETALDTVRFAAKLNTSSIAFGIMVPYPGTRIYEMALKGEGNYRIISSDWADFNKTIGSSLELTTLSRKEMEKLQVMGYCLFYFKNRRFWEFLKLLWSERRGVFAVIKKISI